jgi:NADH-quinone oxidoreductase subunit C
MTPEQLCKTLEQRFGAAVTASAPGTSHPSVTVQAQAWPEVARHLRDELHFSFLRCISALDLLEDDRFAAVYDFLAIRKPEHPHGYYSVEAEFAVRVEVPRGQPEIPSVAAVWPAADWHEREAYDLMGIVFTGHPDTVRDHDGLHPRRILCPDDWVGHPLRKDYLFPMEYHGIPATTEFELTSPRH